VEMGDLKSVQRIDSRGKLESMERLNEIHKESEHEFSY
jgi:hypothetical protein